MCTDLTLGKSFKSACMSLVIGPRGLHVKPACVKLAARHRHKCPIDSHRLLTWIPVSLLASLDSLFFCEDQNASILLCTSSGYLGLK